MRSCRCASLLPSTLQSTARISTCCSVYVCICRLFGQSIGCGARGEKQRLRSGPDTAVSRSLSWPSIICCVLAPLLLPAKVCAGQFLGLGNRMQKRPKEDSGKVWQRRAGGCLPCQLCKGRAATQQSKSRGRIAVSSSLSFHGTLVQEQW